MGMGRVCELKLTPCVGLRRGRGEAPPYPHLPHLYSHLRKYMFTYIHKLNFQCFNVLIFINLFHTIGKISMCRLSFSVAVSRNLKFFFCGILKKLKFSKNRKEMKTRVSLKSLAFQPDQPRIPPHRINNSNFVVPKHTEVMMTIRRKSSLAGVSIQAMLP